MAHGSPASTPRVRSSTTAGRCRTAHSGRRRGWAGIAAARKIVAAGGHAIVLETAPNAGGRARTDHSLGVPVHLGAAWFHGVESNPVAALAAEAGVGWQQSRWGASRTYLLGEPALDEAERARCGLATAVAPPREARTCSVNDALAPCYGRPRRGRGSATARVVLGAGDSEYEPYMPHDDDWLCLTGRSRWGCDARSRPSDRAVDIKRTSCAGRTTVDDRSHYPLRSRECRNRVVTR